MNIYAVHGSHCAVWPRLVSTKYKVWNKKEQQLQSDSPETKYRDRKDPQRLHIFDFTPVSWGYVACHKIGQI